jgi:hypothetical protein
MVSGMWSLRLALRPAIGLGLFSGSNPQTYDYHGLGVESRGSAKQAAVRQQRRSEISGVDEREGAKPRSDGDRARSASVRRSDRAGLRCP